MPRLTLTDSASKSAYSSRRPPSTSTSPLRRAGWRSPAVGWPVALIGASGAFTLFSPDDDDAPSAGDLIVRLYQPALVASLAAPRRRFGLPRRATA